jgi:hypothetical protein
MLGLETSVKALVILFLPMRPVCLTTGNATLYLGRILCTSAAFTVSLQDSKSKCLWYFAVFMSSVDYYTRRVGDVREIQTCEGEVLWIQDGRPKKCDEKSPSGNHARSIDTKGVNRREREIRLETEEKQVIYERGTERKGVDEAFILARRNRY